MLETLRVRRVMRVLETEFAAHRSFLDDLGYGKPAVRIERDSLLGLTIRASFHAPERKLVFGVLAVPRRQRGIPDRHVATAFLYRGSPGQYGGEQDDRLSVDWYALLHRRDLADALDALANERSSIEEFIRAALPIYRTLLQDDMHDIVAGRAWEAGHGWDKVARTFDFLVRDWGFSLPVARWYGHDWNHCYRRGEVKLSLFYDGGREHNFSITVGDKSSPTIYDIPLDEIAGLLKAHPEVLAGDFRAIDALRPKEKSSDY